MFRASFPGNEMELTQHYELLYHMQQSGAYNQDIATIGTHDDPSYNGLGQSSYRWSCLPMLPTWADLTAWIGGPLAAVQITH